MTSNSGVFELPRSEGRLHRLIENIVNQKNDRTTKIPTMTRPNPWRLAGTTADFDDDPVACPACGSSCDTFG
jgi:hypothetical protein